MYLEIWTWSALFGGASRWSQPQLFQGPSAVGYLQARHNVQNFLGSNFNFSFFFILLNANDPSASIYNTPNPPIA